MKIYGASDDLIEVEGTNGVALMQKGFHYSKENAYCEMDVWSEDVKFSFRDGTVVQVGYCKPDLAVWYIEYIHIGTASQTLTKCTDEDAEPCSDVLEIDSEIVSLDIIPKETCRYIGSGKE